MNRGDNETRASSTGGLRLVHPLDFDRSPGTSVGGDPVLFYNSETVHVRPVVDEPWNLVPVEQDAASRNVRM